MGIKEFFCQLFGCKTPCPECPDCPEPTRSIDLIRTSIRDFNGEEGASCAAAIGVMALYADDGSPASHVELRVTVPMGPARLAGGLETKQVHTDQHGRISLDVEMPGPGRSLFEVALEGSPEKSVFFGSFTNEMVQSIYIYAPPCQPAANGNIEMEISVLNYHGEPVTGANLVIEAHNETIFDQPLSGTVTEIGDGRYRANILNSKAGQMNLIAQDQGSLAIGRSNIDILPGAPDHIAIIGETDPRAAEPYHQIDLQVQLQDAQGNPLPPTGLQAKTESGQALPATLQGATAIFSVEAIGYQYLVINLSHAAANLQESISLHFAATWLRDPGLVLEKTTFATSLYVLPRPGTGTDHGTVKIEFDPTLATFKDFVPANGQFEFQYQHSVSGSTLVLQFEAEKTYNTDDYPTGMYLGDVVWDCLGEGDTCFALTGQMSPTTDPWKLCLKQKQDRNDCICINIIYPTGNNAAKNAGTTAANQVTSVISSAANVAKCCPVLKVKLHYCPIPQATINGIIGADGVINTSAEWTAMATNTTCMKAKCINLKMIPVAIPVPGGTSRGRTYIGPPGTSILSPGIIGTAANVGAHELGHSLGLNHASSGGAANNLMHSPQPHGKALTSSQCKTVFQNIGNYAC